MDPSPKERILDLVRLAGVLRPRDLDPERIPRVYLRRMHAAGLLDKPGRGLYVLAGSKPTEHQSLVEVNKRVPNGVICLLSALQFHHLTTQAPFEVWLAIGETDRRPKWDYPPLRIVRFGPKPLEYGVAVYLVDGAKIRVTNPAKTIADCFKYRNKIGLDVALEALKEGWRKRCVSIDELFRAAEVCRVARVIRPYLESLP